MNRRQQFALSFMVWLNVAIATACAHDWPAGSVLCSRNSNESENATPAGSINHLAIYVGQGWLVEAQESRGVIFTRLSDYKARPYYPPGILFPRIKEVGERAAAIAKTHVGRPYRHLSSLAPLIIPPIIPTILHGTPDGENCVSEIRLDYEGAIGHPLIGFRWPNDVMLRPELFTNQAPQ